MDKLTTLQLFTRIVELGSFAQAAEQLGIPKASASNAIKDLESRLNCRLLERTTRQVRPSLDGQAFYARTVQILSELDDAESSLRHVAANPRGVLRVDLHGSHATRVVLPRIDAFHARYPGIELAISSGDRLVDLVREGIDCVVRAGVPRDSTLIARKLAEMPQVICASPDYLQRYGIPQRPDDLKVHLAVNFFSSSRGGNFPFELVINKKIQSYQLSGWISVSDAENYVVCARRGCGLVQLPRIHITDDLEKETLVEVLSEWQSPAMPVSAFYPQHRQLSPRVRVFIDWLSEIYPLYFSSTLR